MTINRVQVSKNFHLSEFQMTRAPHVVMVDPQLISKLQELRDAIGAPIIITSGYRTPEHDRRVGGSGSGQHTLGKAADIYSPNVTHSRMADEAEKIGFGGIGRYSNHTHVDVRSGRARWNG